MNQDLNEEFLNACGVGDASKVKELYHTYYPPVKNIFEKFTNIFNFKKPLLDPHYKDEFPFLTACVGGHLDVIEFLLKEKKFVNGLLLDRIILGLGSAIQNEHIQIANLILPLIKKENQNLEDIAYSSFQSCCKKGKLNGLKYILNNKKLSANKELLNFNEGFIYACENGRINIIEYLVKELNYSYSISKQATKNPKNLIKIKDIDVLHYFVNELQMQNNDELSHRLLLDNKMQTALDNAFEKKKLYIGLNNDLHQSSDTIPKTKKLKL